MALSPPDIASSKKDLAISSSRISAVAHTVFLALKSDIVFGRLHPRERLVETDLTERFKCNRANIREALNELSKLGLVEYVVNKGVSVVHLNIDDIRAIYKVRIELESLAAAWIPLPASKSDIELLTSIQNKHTAAVKSKDFTAIFEHNGSFHEAFNDMCGNKYLTRLIREMAFRALPIRYSAYMSQEYLDDVRDDHLNIIEALATSDRDTLVSVTRLHNQRGLDWYQAQMEFDRS